MVEERSNVRVGPPLHNNNIGHPRLLLLLLISEWVTRSPIVIVCLKDNLRGKWNIMASSPNSVFSPNPSRKNTYPLNPNSTSPYYSLQVVVNLGLWNFGVKETEMKDSYGSDRF